MPVPDTNTFSLKDVVDEISPTSDDLSTCIAEADASYWDTTYATLPATKLSDFRNYGPFEPCSNKFDMAANVATGLGTSDFWAGSGAIPSGDIRITRIDIDSFGGASSSNYVRHNGVDLLLNQDINFEAPFSSTFALDIFVSSGPNGTCTPPAGTFTVQIYYSIKRAGQRYGYCVTGAINQCG